MVGRWISFWDGLFSRVMLVSGRVHESLVLLSYLLLFLLQPPEPLNFLGAPALVAPHFARSRTNVAALREISCEPPKQKRKTPAFGSKSTASKQRVYNSKSIPSLCMTMTLQQALNIPWCSHLTYPIRIAKKNSVKPRSGLGKIYVLLNWKPSQKPWSLPKWPSTFHLFWG